MLLAKRTCGKRRIFVKAFSHWSRHLAPEDGDSPSLTLLFCQSDHTFPLGANVAGVIQVLLKDRWRVPRVV